MKMKKKLNLDLIAQYDYNLLECQNCKFIFQQFIPDEFFSEELYENIISAQDSLKKKQDNITDISKKYHNELSLLKNIFKNKKINILEFGAGVTYSVNKAKKFGFDVSCLICSKKRINY